MTGRSEVSGAAAVGVVVIHGIGRQSSPDFADPFIDRVGDHLRRLGVDGAEVAFEPILWGPVLNHHQDRLLERVQPNSRWWLWRRTREFVVWAMGDAAAYQRVGQGPGTETYQRVHERVRDALGRLRGRVAGEDAPLVIMAHSLGGQIMSNYVWDMQSDPAGRTSDAFEACETLAGMVTFGCNIPIFALASEPVRPIRFPAEQLPKEVRDAALWLNLNDRDDILGYPLKPFAPGYEYTVDEDIEVRIRHPLWGWNPKSHTAYWTSDVVCGQAARVVHRLVEATR